MQVLKRGHTELFRRGSDECFDSLAGLTRFCQDQKEKSVDRWVPPRSLRPRPLALDKLVIDFADPGAKQSEEAYQTPSPPCPAGDYGGNRTGWCSVIG
jgi:hypothetical protein